MPRPVLTVGLVMSLALLGDSLLYLALPARAAELQLPLWSVGILLGANRIVRLVTNSAAAWLFARLGGHPPVVAASALAAATTAAYGLFPTFSPFLVARMGWGACYSVLRLGSFTVVLAASEPVTRGRLVGIYQSLSRIGPFFSLLLGALAVELLGYHTTFVILGLLTLPAIPLALSLRSEAFGPMGSRRHAGDSPNSSAGHASWTWRDRWLGGRRLVAVKLGMLAKGFATQGVVLSTLTLALAEAAGTPDGAAILGGLLVAFRWACDLLLAPLLGHLSDRVGRGRMIPAILLASSLGVGALAISTSRETVIVATLVIFFLSTAMSAASDAAAGDLASPDRRAEVMSGYSDWVDVGAALGPPIAFLLADWLGLRASYAVTAVVLAAAGAQFIIGWRRA